MDANLLAGTAAKLTVYRLGVPLCSGSQLIAARDCLSLDYYLVSLWIIIKHAL